MQGQPDTLLLTIASVGETRFDGPARSVTLPGSVGEFTILPHHEPIVTTLKRGTVRVLDASGETRQFQIESGVLECSANRVIVLL